MIKIRISQYDDIKQASRSGTGIWACNPSIVTLISKSFRASVCKTHIFAKSWSWLSSAICSTSSYRMGSYSQGGDIDEWDGSDD